MFPNASAPPHTRSDFYFFNLWAPTHVHQFEAAAMAAKTDAFLKHASQYAQQLPDPKRTRSLTPIPPCAPSPPPRYPDPSLVSKILQFIGANTPHYSQQAAYAEGFQLFS